MFESKSLPIIVPQQEHARLAGFLAFSWGNKDFDKPAYSLEAIATGLTFHHMGYGPLDTVAFRELPEDEILEVFKKDIAIELGDVDAELVNLFHQLRLVNNRLARGNSEGFLKLQKKIESMIAAKLTKSNFSREDFEWANRITHLCDRLSFNFCQGEVAEAAVDVYSQRESLQKVSISNWLVGTDTIVVDPWPFAKDEIHFVVIAYLAEKYPQTLLPHLIHVQILPNK